MTCRTHGRAFWQDDVCEACLDDHGGCMACLDPERYDDHTCADRVTTRTVDVLNEAADIIEAGTIGNDAEAKRRDVVCDALRRLAEIHERRELAE